MSVNILIDQNIYDPNWITDITKKIQSPQTWTTSQYDGTSIKKQTWTYQGTWSKNEERHISVEEFIAKILENNEDPGFFRDILDWLKNMAPKKIYPFVKELYSSSKLGFCSYEKMCELIYRLEFKANELIETRMILGPNNKWVRKYFEDFPITNK